MLLPSTQFRFVDYLRTVGLVPTQTNIFGYFPV
jgi:hypothetical protein